jgi:signal transduction histidine kinase
MVTQSQLTPEILVPRLGDYLVEKNIIQTNDLQKALQRQRELREKGEECLLGQALIDLNLIDRATLDHAVTEQILQLRQALQDTNAQLELRVQQRTAELQNALKKLSEMNQLQSNIIANISHELRTPMTHIKGYLELIASGSLGEINEEQKNALNVLQRSSTRLEQQIEDLIHFSAASKGEFTLIWKDIRIEDLFKIAVDRSTGKAHDRKITLNVKIAPHLPEVHADEEKISWVLIQLMDNAIKFTPENGEVMLSADIEQDYVKICVADSGIGIPSDRFGEIFEPFHQLDGSSSRHYGGTGLGLALVQQIIEAHGSVIRVESKMGTGTRFEFLLAPAA